MVRDRLVELKRVIAMSRSRTYGSLELVESQATPLNRESLDLSMEPGDEIADAYDQVHDIRVQIDGIQPMVDRVEELQSLILSSPVPEEQAQQELTEQMDAIKLKSQRIRGKLKEMEQCIAYKEEDAARTGIVTAALRMLKVQHATLVNQFVEVLIGYQMAQANHRDGCKARIVRQLEIGGREFTDDEVEEMVQTGNWSTFAPVGIQDVEKAKRTLAEIEERHNDIIKLEKSIRDLHDLFMELAILVQCQGDVIDHVETHVQNTKEFVGAGTKHLKEALSSVKKTRKKKILLGIIILISILVLALIIYFSIK